MTKAKAFMPAGIRNKLMAAIAMLLVATIMMVSSTYAWFTLSTAPEVTGITTSVGANGNLEIALLNGSATGTTENDTWATMSRIKSAVGDSSTVKGAKDANITWGNLVDLSDASYGSSKFVLNPARLSLTNGVPTLKTPAYGTDGRVTTLSANTVTGTYATDKASFVEGNYGVRAIGVAAAMSNQQLAMRNAIAQVALNTSAAKNAVQNSLITNGSALATLAVGFANDEENYTATNADVNALNALITELNAAKTKLGTAIQYALMAEKLSDDADAALELKTEEFDNYPIPESYTGNESITNAIVAYKEINVPEAATSENVKTTMEALIGSSNAKVNNIALSEVKDKIGEIASSAMQGGLTVVPGTDSPYTKVAALTGDVNASITITELKYDKIELHNQPATMNTNATGNKMAPVATYIAGLTAKEATNSEISDKITDIYGYAVDFAFRTNAASSKLLLQVEEAQRIYSDGNDAATQGGGSYMKFTKGSDLTGAQFKDLMDAVRIVFTDENGAVVAGAKLDTGEFSDETTFKAPLKLVNYTISDSGADEGKITASAEKGNNEIMSLNQNTATKLTVTVYLDGDVVDNSMVSATSARSMTGSMNLQFASSATLVPMDYTPLHSVNTTTPTTPVTPEESPEESGT